MKSSAPWSVKGIERDARETAKDAAKREGMTVGEWLNQMIYAAGDAAPSGGDVEGLKLRDIVTAIEHLNKRIADSQTQSAGAAEELTRKIGDVVERIQRLERVKPAQGSHDDLAARIARLERQGGDRERIDALKALEKAVSQVAVQFNAAQKTSVQRLDSTERQLQELAARIDAVGGGGGDAAGVGRLQDAVEGLSARLARAERIAGEATKLKTEAAGSVDPGFVESTGNRLRVLGDEIKRGGDQIRALEATIAKLSGQIDAAERRSAEGVQKVADAIADMRERFSGETSRADIDAAVAAATQETEERVSALQRSFDAMIARLETLDGAGAESPPAAGIAAEDRSGDDSDEDIRAQADALARDLEALAGDDADESGAPAQAQFDAARAGDAFDEESFDEDGPAAQFEPDADADASVGDDASDAPEAAAADDEDADDDPFAFADEIDAALEDSGDAAEDDDFRFELDDDSDDAESADKTMDGPAQQLLSEVKEAFAKPVGSTDDEDADRGAAHDDDLDALLADLDAQMGVAADAAETEPAGSDADEPVKGSQETEAEPASEQDMLRAARNRAIEAAQRAAKEDRPGRRQLTPKQKAILAARARQKRLAAETGTQIAPDPQKLSAAKEALRDRGEEPAESADEDAEQGRFAKITAAVAALRDRLPFLAKKPDTAKKVGAAGETARPRNDDRAAFETLKATASARPVTLALAVGIFLSIAALFYLIKDIVFTSSEPPSAQPAAAVSKPPASPAGEETAAPAAAVPGQPAIDPRVLYGEAITALAAADADADTSEAIGKLQEAAALGHPPAQLQLGELYKTGQGVDKDLSQARTWFRRAANGGNILAMHRIGVMTARGDGGPADTAEAIGWFERAANRGLVDSQYNLGAIYHPSDDGGASTVQDAGKAYYWYSLAAKNGDEQAAPLAESVASLLTPAEKRDLDQAIADWEALPADEAANDLAPPAG